MEGQPTSPVAPRRGSHSRTVGILVAVVLGLIVISHFVVLGLTEHSSCNQYENADASAQDAVLATMTAAHNEAGQTGMARLSVDFYCKLNPSQPIDGIYSGN